VNVPARARLARRAALYVSSISRRLGLGGGSVIGGRVGLILEPELLSELARGRKVALVSGTNGKTTTTRLLAAALGGPGTVATSSAGANLPSGLAIALASSAPGAPAVLEVDEGYLPRVADAVDPEAIALLNLSRDQLDRVSEVRMVAARWRAALAGRERVVVVANADDPLVTWSASAAPSVVWVAAGQLWHADSVGCPACEGRIVFAGDGEWWCNCGFRRPEPDAWLEDDEIVTRGGRRTKLGLSLPGRCNRANAAIALECANILGADIDQALAAMRAIGDVEGRFAVFDIGGKVVRLLLAKNPAGWTELLDLIRGSSDAVVIGINARVADGHDPSWLWDVPFEQLRGRSVLASGERCLDLAVRLRHAEVEHVVVRDQHSALLAADSRHVDYVGNYTAFQQLRRYLDRFPSSSYGAVAPPTASEIPSAASTPNSGGAPSRRRSGDGVSALRVVVVHPDLLGTYGDGGNGLVLVNRARWRGLDATLVMAPSDEPLPAGADLYCLGGGEDGPQVQSAQLLADGSLRRAVDAGAAVLAVCAGFQVVGEFFPDAQGKTRSGAGLLEVSTVKGAGKRAVGELVADPTDPLPFWDGGHGAVRLERLTGFENHGGVTRLGPGVRALAHVLGGIGNGAGDRSEGAVCGRIVGTYMHGPVLARNPSLADALLALVNGSPLPPLDDAEEDLLRAERFAAVPLHGRRYLPLVSQRL